MSDSHSTRSLHSGSSTTGSIGSSPGNGASPRAPLLGSSRSSLSSLASERAASQPATTSGLTHALAIAANKWDREQKKQDVETTRRLTLLRQRKISAVLKVENLHKNLNPSNTVSGGNGTIQTHRLQQVKELEQEVAAVDKELTDLVAEREDKTRKLNSKRVQHVTTLQQLGLLEHLSVDSAERWRSEMNLKKRKVSPPVLDDESRMRSGSDPSLAFSSMPTTVNNNENQRPNGKGKSPAASPKPSRRNPLRMLSNAIDFRNKKRHQRPKSADFDRVSEDPGGDSSTDGSFETNPIGLLSPPLPQYNLSSSRHSLPSLDPSEMEAAVARAKASSSTRLPHLHILENRNSAPEIVVTSHVVQNQSSPSSLFQSNNGRRSAGKIEEKINRAKARVQNGLNLGSSLGSATSASKPQKLSTRFQPSQKTFNNRLAALAVSAGVRRSRTFNISDVQEQLITSVNTNGQYSAKTLPKPVMRHHRLKKQKSHVIEKMMSISPAGSLSGGGASGSSSTSSSRKSSNSSNNSSLEIPEVVEPRAEISEDALKEIAEFERFAAKYWSGATRKKNLAPTLSTNKKMLRRLKPQIDRQRKLSPQEIQELASY